MMSIKHSSANCCWYTPTEIIEAARGVLRTIDFDPASDEFGNSRVKATGYLSEHGTDIITWPRDRTVFLNPPSGRANTHRSLPVAFWQALLDYREGGHLKHAIFVAFSIEQLQTSQSASLSMMHFPFCVPRKRLAFAAPPDRPPPRAPTHSNAIVYVPGTIDATHVFVDRFAPIGRVVVV